MLVGAEWTLCSVTDVLNSLFVFAQAINYHLYVINILNVFKQVPLANHSVLFYNSIRHLRSYRLFMDSDYRPE